MVLRAARELGVPILATINGDVGYGIVQKTLDKGRRVSASKAYLSPIKTRNNLYVMKSTAFSCRMILPVRSGYA